MLNEKQLKAIELMLDGSKTKTDIAKEVKIERGTLYDWLNKEEFVKELDKRTHIFKTSIQKNIDRKMMQNVDIAVDTLVDLMKTSDNAETKRKCAESIIERIAGKVTNDVSVNVVEQSENLETAKGLLNKYRPKEEDEEE